MRRNSASIPKIPRNARNPVKIFLILKKIKYKSIKILESGKKFLAEVLAKERRAGYFPRAPPKLYQKSYRPRS